MQITRFYKRTQHERWPCSAMKEIKTFGVSIIFKIFDLTTNSAIPTSGNLPQYQAASYWLQNSMTVMSIECLKFRP